MSESSPRRRARHLRSSGGAALIGAFLVAGCYSTEPIRTGEPQRDASVVAHLTDEGSIQLISMLGGPAEQVEGVVRSNGEEGLTLAVQRVSYRTGLTSRWNGETLLLPAETVGWLGERRLDKTRSYVAAAGLTAGAILLGRLIGTAVTSDGGDVEQPVVPPF